MLPLVCIVLKANLTFLVGAVVIRCAKECATVQRKCFLQCAQVMDDGTVLYGCSCNGRRKKVRM